MTEQTVTDLRDQADLPKAPGASPWLRRLETLLAVTAALVAVLAIWLVHRPIGDLYVALAAGRDVLQGKLGQPDEWSFTASDRVWINQNWGTHLMYYLSHVVGGEWGLLTLKAALVALMGLGVALACRTRRNSWAIACVMAGAVLLSGKAFIDQRPNLTSLALDPIMLWLLYRTRNHPHRMWWATALLAVWANMHGGFLFAIGMMGLWAVCHLVAGAVRMGVGASIRRYWPLAAATGVAILSAALLTPFGLFQAMGSETFLRNWNLTHPFIMAESDVWKSVREWRPVFDISRIKYGSAWEFCVILGVLGTAGLAKLVTVVVRKQPVRPRHLYTAVLLLMVFTLIAIITVSAYATDLNSRSVARHHPREVPIEVKHMFDLARMVLAGSLIVAGGAAVTGAVLFGRTRGSDTYRPAGPARLGMWAFDVLLSLLVVYMAFTARRFIPLAVVVIAPLVARQLQWVCSQRVVPLPGMKPATIATGVVIAAASIAGIALMGEAGLFLLGGVALSIIWLANSLRVNSFRVCPPAVLAIAVAVLAGQLAAENLRYYNPANPFVRVESFYDRMVGQERQATKMTRFMRENDIEGRILHEWRWEGYLHWRVPELKLLLGGRAQQIYSEQDYYTGMSLRYGSDTRTTVRSDDPFYTRRELDRLDVHLLAAPTEPGWKWLLVRLTQEDPRSGWTYLYRDGRDALLADTNDPEKRRLVEQALRGELDYPSRGIEAFSQASILRTRAGRSIAEKLAQTGQGPKTTADRAFRLFLESLRLDPSPQAAIEAFNLFSSLKENIRDLNANSDKPAGQRPGDQLRQVYIDLLEATLAGMAERPLDQWGGYEILESRRILLRLLGEFYAQADRRERTQQVIQRVNRLRQTRSRLIEKWR